MTGRDAIELVVAALVVARLWRIAAIDVPYLLDHLAAALSGEDTWGEFVDAGVSCPWCLGWWLSCAAAVVLAGWTPGAVVVALALSQAVGMLGSRST